MIFTLTLIWFVTIYGGKVTRRANHESYESVVDVEAVDENVSGTTRRLEFYVFGRTIELNVRSR